MLIKLLEIDGKLTDIQISTMTSFLAKAKGLLGKKSLPANEGVLLLKCNSIHMFWMRFSVDVVFVDDQFIVVKVVPFLKPWLIARCKKASSTFELSAGMVKKFNIENGSCLKVF